MCRPSSRPYRCVPGVADGRSCAEAARWFLYIIPLWPPWHDLQRRKPPHCRCTRRVLLQSLLSDPNPGSPANGEAARLYNENRCGQSCGAVVAFVPHHMQDIKAQALHHAMWRKGMGAGRAHAHAHRPHALCQIA